MENKKIRSDMMKDRLRDGVVLLAPLTVSRSEILDDREGADARIELGWPGQPERFSFLVDIKPQATPQAVRLSIDRAKRQSALSGRGENPMILVPYLSPEQLAVLEQESISGVDMGGNGLVIVPGRLCVMRSGAPNLFPDSRPLNNPYRGKSALVARTILQQKRWETLADLASCIRSEGGEVSISQVSKAVTAMQEDLILTKNGGEIILNDPLRLLDKLASEWRPRIGSRQGLRLPDGVDGAARLSISPGLKWAVTGESSAGRYVTLSQGGPRRLAVSNIRLAAMILGGSPEAVPNFADVELCETDEPGYFFGNKGDERRVRWASRLQAWLEMQAGDARQQEAAAALRRQLIEEVQP